MSRLYLKNGRSRQPPIAAPRLLKTKDFADGNYQEPASKRNRKTSKYATNVQQAKRRRKAATPSSSDSSDGFDADDASDEQSEDDAEDDDLPAVNAPSLHGIVGETGRFYDGVPRAGSVESMFGENGLDLENQDLPTLEDMRRFEENLFANASDDDDAAYAAVEDISDSDDEAINHREEQLLIDELSEDDELEELDLLNQIDGMSAYGFGDDSEGTAAYPPSSQGSDSADEVGPARHVHFNVDPAHAFNPSLSESPTFSRALLPSALPHSASLEAAAVKRAHDESDSDEDYDSDATDDCLPPEAEFQDDDDEEEVERAKSPPTPRTAARKKAECKGPPRGIFIDEGTKATGMLDKSGKIMLITHPHLLGDEFARRYGNSAASSPTVGFEELLSESDFAETPNLNHITPASEMDMMLNHGNAIDANGIVTGPQEAFFPTGFDLGFGDDFDLGLDDGEDLGEDVIRMDDVIKFDDDSDGSEAPTSPFFMTPKAPSTNQFWAPSSSTVTAFRRHQDSFKTTPSFSRFAELSSPQSALTGSRKRKATNESPYASAHYKGVTPVQRMTNTGSTLPSTPDTVRPKRQRIMTA